MSAKVPEINITVPQKPAARWKRILRSPHLWGLYYREFRKAYSPIGAAYQAALSVKTLWIQ